MSSGRSPLSSIEASVSVHEDDPRWQLVLRILASRYFARAPLLSRFLAHICAETLNGNHSEISEYQIGVQVFDRPRNYRTVEDNIVRNYARQLRKRLAEYFGDEGSRETLRIEIPLGGYIPVFSPALGRPKPVESIHPADHRRTPQTSETLDHTHAQREKQELPLPEPLRNSVLRWSARVALFIAYTALLIAGTLLAAQWIRAARHPSNPSSRLWNALFRSQLDTLIVPADCGFNILQDLSHKQIALAGYLDGDYLNNPLPDVDSHSQADLRTQQFTSFVDLKVVSSLARLPQVDPERFLVRFPRDLRLDDLKSSNVILIGSDASNPWSEIAQRNLNFRIVYGNVLQSAWIVNSHPRTGEAERYVSHWDEPSHPTYAVVAYEPNLDGNGHMLLIEGLDVAGTEAAAEALLRGDVFKPVLNAAANGQDLKPFEVLLQSTSIASNAASAHVVAFRVD